VVAVEHVNLKMHHSDHRSSRLNIPWNLILYCLMQQSKMIEKLRLKQGRV
jgi:hypothetical protein